MPCAPGPQHRALEKNREVMVKDRRLIAKISRQGSHVTTSRGHTPLSSTSCLTQHKRKQQSKETRKPYLRSNLENWVYQSEARVGLGNAGTTNRERISSEEPSPPGEKGADFVFCYSFGITLFLQAQYLDTENLLDEL